MLALVKVSRWRWRGFDVLESELIEDRPGAGVALVRINRPETLNALDQELRNALAKPKECSQDGTCLQKSLCWSNT